LFAMQRRAHKHTMNKKFQEIASTWMYGDSTNKHDSKHRRCLLSLIEIMSDLSFVFVLVLRLDFKL